MPRRFFVFLTVCSVIALHAPGATERATANGKVVDPQGKPIDRATALVYEAHTRQGYSVYCPTCWVDCGKRTISNAEGNYTITGLNPDLVFKLLVVKPGYKTVFVDKVDPSKGPAGNADLQPAALATDLAQTVRGRVVDDHGNPLRDVVVEQQGITFNGPHGRGRSFGPDDSPDWIQPLAATDEEGDFEIAYAKPAAEITLSISPRAMAPRLETLPTGPQKRTISVAQGATLRGRLVQPNGSPAASAEIGVVVHSRAMGTVFPEVRIGTKNDGTFVITNIPAGRIWYVYPKMKSLADRGLAGDAMPFETKDDGEEVDAGTLRLHAAYTLHGKVVLSDGKAIPPGMHVTLSSDAGFDNQITTIAESGSFEFGGLSKGVYSISAGVRGYKSKDGFYGEVLIDRNDKQIVIPMTPSTLRH